MALAILDGTQTATTLSTILSSGQHITAHTVVSLGTQAKTDILSAVSSGIAISGTVTANLNLPSFAGGDGDNLTAAVQIGYYDDNFGEFRAVNSLNSPLPIISTGLVEVAIRSTSSLPAGTNSIGVVTIGAGTVTIGAGTAQIGSVTASISGTVPISISSVTIGNFPATQAISIASVTVGNSVTIGSLPAIAGTVTANIAISSSAITSGVFSSLTSATLVPANTARKMATVYNLGAGQLFVNAGASATTLGGGFMVALSSGDYFECPFTTTTLSALFASAGTASWVSH